MTTSMNRSRTCRQLFSRNACGGPDRPLPKERRELSNWRIVIGWRTSAPGLGRPSTPLGRCRLRHVSRFRGIILRTPDRASEAADSIERDEPESWPCLRSTTNEAGPCFNLEVFDGGVPV